MKFSKAQMGSWPNTISDCVRVETHAQLCVSELKRKEWQGAAQEKPYIPELKKDCQSHV